MIILIKTNCFCDLSRFSALEHVVFTSCIVPLTMTRTLELRCLMAAAVLARRPYCPAAGTTTASSLGTWSKTSMPTVPSPARYDSLSSLGKSNTDKQIRSGSGTSRSCKKVQHPCAKIRKLYYVTFCAVSWWKMLIWLITGFIIIESNSLHF